MELDILLPFGASCFYHRLVNPKETKLTREVIIHTLGLICSRLPQRIHIQIECLSSLIIFTALSVQQVHHTIK